jgi:hypothetical protein
MQQSESRSRLMELIGANIYARTVQLHRDEFSHRQRLVNEFSQAIQRVKEGLARKRATLTQAHATFEGAKLKADRRALSLRVTTEQEAAA